MKQIQAALGKLIARLEGIENAARPDTLAQVNKFLAEHGHEERLAKGKGYFYFYDGIAHTFADSSVMVPKLSLLSQQGWLDELVAKKTEAKRYDDTL